MHYDQLGGGSDDEKQSIDGRAPLDVKSFEIGEIFHAEADKQANALYDVPIFLQKVSKCPESKRFEERQTFWQDFQAVPWIGQKLTEHFQGGDKALFQEVLLQTIMIMGFPESSFDHPPEIDVFGKKGFFGLGESEFVYSHALHVFREQEEDNKVVRAYCEEALAHVAQPVIEPYQDDIYEDLGEELIDEEPVQARWRQAEFQDQFDGVIFQEMRAMIRHLAPNAPNEEKAGINASEELYVHLAGLLLEQIELQTIKFNKKGGDNILLGLWRAENGRAFRDSIETMLKKVVFRRVLTKCKDRLPFELSLTLGFSTLGRFAAQREEEKAQYSLMDAWVYKKRSSDLWPSEIMRCALERHCAIMSALKDAAGPGYRNYFILRKQINWLFGWRKKQSAASLWLFAMWKACTSCCPSKLSETHEAAGYTCKNYIFQLVEGFILAPITQNSVGKFFGDSFALNKLEKREATKFQQAFSCSLLFNFMVFYPLAISTLSLFAAVCSFTPVLLCLLGHGWNLSEAFRPPRLEGLKIDDRTRKVRMTLISRQLFAVWTLSVCLGFLMLGVDFANEQAFFSALSCYIFSHGVILSNVFNNSIGLTFWNTTNRYRDEYLTPFLRCSAFVWIFGLMSSYFNEIAQYKVQVAQYYWDEFANKDPAQVNAACDNAYPMMFDLYNDPTVSVVFVLAAVLAFLGDLYTLACSFFYNKHWEFSKDQQDIRRYAQSVDQIQDARRKGHIMEGPVDAPPSNHSAASVICTRHKSKLLLSAIAIGACIALAVRCRDADDFYHDQLATLMKPGSNPVEQLMAVNKKGHVEYLTLWAFRGKQVFPASAAVIIFLACAKCVWQDYQTHGHFMDSDTLQQRREENERCFRSTFFSSLSFQEEPDGAALGSLSP